MKKNDKKELIAVWGERFTDTNISLIGGLVHSYFRNTMIHGYRGRGVFLSFQQDTLMLLQDGYLILNPNLFWNSFVNAFNKEFNSIIEDGKINQQNIKVKAIKAYLHELIHK